jgi:hypothetical protein
VSHVKVAQLLHDQHCSLRSNRKTEEGGDHPDRDARFRHINTTVKRSLAAVLPVISVDTKKKELIGHYHRGRPAMASGTTAGHGEWARCSGPRRATRLSVRDP